MPLAQKKPRNFTFGSYVVEGRAFSARQFRTAAAYVFSGRSRPTHAEIARRFGVSRSAISHRLRQFRQRLTESQLSRYLTIARPGRKHRVTPMQLNFADEV